MRIAVLPGSKDSLYAALKAWPIDLGIILIYDFPRPSPYLLNLNKGVETLCNTEISIVTVRLGRGRDETVNVLRKLGTDDAY